MAMGIRVTAANESTGVQNPRLSQIRSSSRWNPTPYVGRVSSYLRDSVWSGLLSSFFSPFSPNVQFLTLGTFTYSYFSDHLSTLTFMPTYIHQSMWWLLSYVASKFVQHMLSAWPQTHDQSCSHMCQNLSSPCNSIRFWLTDVKMYTYTYIHTYLYTCILMHTLGQNIGQGLTGSL